MGIKKVETKIRQAQIAEAALKAIARNGLKGFTITTIAKKVGVASGNIYRHFKDKNAVMDAIVSEIERSLKIIVRESCRESDTPNECLERIFFKHIDFLEKHKGIPRVIFSDEMYSADKKIADKLKEIVKRYQEDIRKVLIKGIKDKTFDADLNVDAAVMTFIGLIQSTALQWVLFGYSFSPKVRGREIWQIYLKGILSRR